MSCWNKKELENMLEDVVNELDLSDSAIAEHGPNGTPPAELVRLVLAEKDEKIRLLQKGFTGIKTENNKKLNPKQTKPACVDDCNKCEFAGGCEEFGKNTHEG